MTNEEKMAFLERAANSALSGIIASDKEIDFRAAASQAYEFADHMFEQFSQYAE